MRQFGAVLALSAFLFVSVCVAQQTSTSSVPSLIRYGGVLKDADGAVLVSQTVGITFALYKQQDGGVALWTETRNVTTDAAGQYNVMLGSTKSEGVPAELFSDQEQRWLAVQVQGQPEPTRVLLVSVPYAFKAHEAETLGGLPASAFAQVSPSQPGTGQPQSGSPKNESSASFNALASPAISGSGTKNYIAIWTSSTNLGNSAIYQLSGNVGIGTAFPTSKLTVVGTASGNAINSASNYQIGGTSVLSTPGTQNLFLGPQAGQHNTTGVSNTFSGDHAGYNNTAGGGNSYFGNQAGFNVTGSGNDRNTFVGHQAGFGGSPNAFSDDNTYVGYWAGRASNFGGLNTSIGAYAGAANAGWNNTFVGGDAGWVNVGAQNTFIGTIAGQLNIGGGGDIFLGFNAGGNNTTGSSDIDIGNDGCPYPCIENHTIRIGTQGTGSRQQNVTYIAGIYGNAPSGASLVVVNAQGQLGTTTGLGLPPGSPYYIQNGTAQQPTSNFNISGNGTAGGTLSAAAGYQIGPNNVLTIPGANNLFVGVAAGQANTSGFDNTFSGAFAGSAVTTGSYNTYSGAYAGSLNIIGGEPVNALTAPGTFNTAFGSFAGTVPVGVFATTTNNNIDIGFRAGYGRSSGNNNINIGYQVCPNPSEACPENKTIHIGNDTDSSYPQQNAAYVAGIYQESVDSSTGVGVLVDSAGKLGSILSSRRFKEQVRDMGDSSSRLFQLRPVTFFYKPEYDKGARTPQYGLIAEEVAEVYPDLVVYDKDGQPLTVKYHLLAPMLLNELQKQHSVVTAQQQEIEGLKSQLQLQNAAFQERLSRLESLVTTQMQAAADKPSQATTPANGGLQ